MTNETTLKNNLTVVGTVNEVSKEETIMGTTMNNEVIVIEFATAEQLNHRLNIKSVHSEGYLAKAEIGEILGLSKNKINSSKREELVETLKVVINKAYRAQIDKQGKEIDKAKVGTIKDKIMDESSKCSMLLRRLEIEDENSKYYMTNQMIGIELNLSEEEISSLDRNILVERLKFKLAKYLHDERIRMGKEIDKPKTTAKTEEKEEAKKEPETKDKTPQEKLNSFLEDLHKVALENKQKGYGTTITAFMFDALILKHQYGIDNTKEALKKDAETRKTGKGEIIVTQEKINKIKEIKKWLINKGLIKAAIYTSDTHKNYYLEDVYDGNYAKSMTKLTEEIYSLLYDVKTVSYRVF